MISEIEINHNGHNEHNEKLGEKVWLDLLLFWNFVVPVVFVVVNSRFS